MHSNGKETSDNNPFQTLIPSTATETIPEARLLRHILPSQDAKWDVTPSTQVSKAEYPLGGGLKPKSSRKKGVNLLSSRQDPIFSVS